MLQLYCLSTGLCWRTVILVIRRLLNCSQWSHKRAAWVP